MQHPDIKLILATGGPGMVKAAYSSGHPSLGVGAGNTPAVIEKAPISKWQYLRLCSVKPLIMA